MKGTIVLLLQFVARPARYIFGFLLLFPLLSGFNDDGFVRPEAYFVPGHVIRFVLVYEIGAQRTNTVFIDRVSVSNGIATIDGTYNHYDTEGKIAKAYRVKYYCDSINWCVSMINQMEFPAKEQPDVLREFEGDSMIYPLGMKPGDTLPGAYGKGTVTSKTFHEAEQIYVFARRVIRCDTVATPMGNIVAFRIDYKIRNMTKTGFPTLNSSNSNNVEISCSDWFSPALGVVKTERTSKYGMRRLVIHSNE